MEYLMKNNPDLTKKQREEGKANAAQSSNGLPLRLKSGIENLSGLSMDNVRVHYNSAKPAQLQALAYTQGTDIHVAPGQARHLSHEAWHVVQQKQGRVRPTMHKNGVSINDNQMLEQEADRMGAKAIQTQSSLRLPEKGENEIYDIVQRKHVKINETIDESPLTLKVEPEPEAKYKPTMVFESMGSEENVTPIFEEAKKYTGNAICVYGVNNRQDDLDTKKGLNKPANGDAGIHFLRGFSFVWKKPELIKETDQYKMPFIEARTLVMGEASKVVENVKHVLNVAADDEIEVPFLYRWIDGDARDDTSGNIDGNILIEFANESEAKIGTGSYDWRHEKPLDGDDKKYLAYKTFVTKINEEEHTLRMLYFEHLKNLTNNEQEKKLVLQKVIDKILSIDHKSGSAVTKAEESDRNTYRVLYNSYKIGEAPEYKSASYLPGFYLPESTFLMNSAAHNKILENGRGEKGEGEQSKESMKMAEVAEVPVEKIQFINELSVSKPLKKEFVESGSYFFNAKMKTFVEGKDYNRELLINALGGFRQSAFDSTKWYFKDKELKGMFDIKKEEAYNRLEIFLKEKEHGNESNFTKLKKVLPLKKELLPKK